MPFALPFPNFDPVLIQLGPFALRWYALAYIVGILLGWLYARALIRAERPWGGPAPMTVADYDDFIVWVTLGIIVGGRLGYVLFYNPSYFVAPREVALKIATMSETSPEVIKAVEMVMRQKLSSVVSQDYAAIGGAKSLADILNLVDMQTERHVLEALDKDDPELAEEIRLLLFIFDDIVKLDDRGVQLVLKEVNQKDLVLALRGADDEVKKKILSNMSPAARTCSARRWSSSRRSGAAWSRRPSRASSA